MNIFLRELRANFKSLLIWSAIVILFTVVGFSKFSAFYNNPDMLAILKDMPKGFVEAFNMGAFNLTTLTGFFGVMIVYFSLILTIAAAMWGSDIITKEERDRTVEFALTLPVTRSRLVTAKIAAAAVNSLVLLLVCWGITLAMAQSYQPDTQFYNFVATTMLADLLLIMIFLALGVFLGCALKQHKRAGSLVVTILLGTYIASVVTQFSKSLDFLKYISPFKYFNTVLMLNENRLEVPYVLLSLAIVVVCLAGAYTAYARRNLYI